jgi:hypothetical protein
MPGATGITIGRQTSPLVVLNYHVPIHDRNDGQEKTYHILVVQDTVFVNRQRDCIPLICHNPECLRTVIA